MSNPENLKYSKSHEWISMEGNKARIGITQYAQEQLGDIVFVSLPEAGDLVECSVSCGELESVKVAAELISPVSGRVLEVNALLGDSPEMVNQSPYEAWMLIVGDITETEELLSAEEYQEFTDSEG